MLKFKKLYQTTDDEFQPMREAPTIEIVEQSDAEKAKDDRMIQEINAFHKDKRRVNEMETYLKFVFEQEYKMLMNFYPSHELLVDEELKQKQLE